MQPFTDLHAKAAPLDLANLDTDQIIPKQFLKTVDREGLGQGLFYDLRFDAEGRPRPDFVLNDPRYQGANFDANVAAAQKVTDIGKSKGAKPGQIALAWLLHKGDDTAPIPGTKRRKYLEENAAATDVKLTAEDLRRIDEVAPHGAAAGPRYPEHMMATVNR